MSCTHSVLEKKIKLWIYVIFHESRNALICAPVSSPRWAVRSWCFLKQSPFTYKETLSIAHCLLCVSTEIYIHMLRPSAVKDSVLLTHISPMQPSQISRKTLSQANPYLHPIHPLTLRIQAPHSTTHFLKI